MVGQRHKWGRWRRRYDNINPNSNGYSLALVQRALSQEKARARARVRFQASEMTGQLESSLCNKIWRGAKLHIQDVQQQVPRVAAPRAATAHLHLPSHIHSAACSVRRPPPSRPPCAAHAGLRRGQGGTGHGDHAQHNSCHAARGHLTRANSGILTHIECRRHVRGPASPHVPLSLPRNTLTVTD